jgi:hypothetical protein
MSFCLIKQLLGCAVLLSFDAAIRANPRKQRVCPLTEGHLGVLVGEMLA